MPLTNPIPYANVHLYLVEKPPIGQTLLPIVKLTTGADAHVITNSSGNGNFTNVPVNKLLAPVWLKTPSMDPNFISLEDDSWITFSSDSNGNMTFQEITSNNGTLTYNAEDPVNVKISMSGKVFANAFNGIVNYGFRTVYLIKKTNTSGTYAILAETRTADPTDYTFSFSNINVTVGDRISAVVPKFGFIPAGTITDADIAAFYDPNYTNTKTWFRVITSNHNWLNVFLRYQSPILLNTPTKLWYSTLYNNNPYRQGYTVLIPISKITSTHVKIFFILNETKSNATVSRDYSGMGPIGTANLNSVYTCENMLEINSFSPVSTANMYATNLLSGFLSSHGGPTFNAFRDNFLKAFIDVNMLSQSYTQSVVGKILRVVVCDYAATINNNLFNLVNTGTFPTGDYEYDAYTI